MPTQRYSTADILKSVFEPVNRGRLALAQAQKDQRERKRERTDRIYNRTAELLPKFKPESLHLVPGTEYYDLNQLIPRETEADKKLALQKARTEAGQMIFEKWSALPKNEQTGVNLFKMLGTAGLASQTDVANAVMRSEAAARRGKGALTMSDILAGNPDYAQRYYEMSRGVYDDEEAAKNWKQQVTESRQHNTDVTQRIQQLQRKEHRTAREEQELADLPKHLIPEEKLKTFQQNQLFYETRASRQKANLDFANKKMATEIGKSYFDMMMGGYSNTPPPAPADSSFGEQDNSQYW